jgi:hypothetical protein
MGEMQQIRMPWPLFLTNLEGKVGRVGKEGRLREKKAVANPLPDFTAF